VTAARAWYPRILAALAGIAIVVTYFSGQLHAEAAVALLVLTLAITLAFSAGPSLGALRDALMAAAAGDFSRRLDASTHSPRAPLAEAFNRMALNLEQRMRAAAEEQSRLAAALNSSIDAVLALGDSGVILYANSAATGLFKRPVTEIVGRPLAWIIPDETIQTAIRAARDGNEGQINSVEGPSRNYLQVVTTAIRGGGEWAVLAVFHDLTDVRRTELVRRDFVANVSHELRTPLAAIKAVLETLAGGAIEEPRVAADFIARADAEVDRIIELVEELLELSRIESGTLPLQKRRTDLAALLSAVHERLLPQAQRKQQQLRLVLPDASMQPDIDPARIERAVVNLVQNAIKFTPEGGTVTVEAQALADRVEVRVSDDGIGISSQDLPRVFERFYKVDQSRAGGGAGLGLALARHAIESHGGEISVESRLGQGTTFRFSVPLRQ
jgi:two-component system phosphate regulon sensor histidine kinase PhoR